MTYDTDVNVACLGEVVFGCCKARGRRLRDHRHRRGAGVMCAGRLLHGMLHPEAGHMLKSGPVPPRKGRRCVCPSHASCLEGLASGPAIAARWGKPAAELADNAGVGARGDYLGQMCANLVHHVLASPYRPRRRRDAPGAALRHRPQEDPRISGWLHPDRRNKDMESCICAPGCGGDHESSARPRLAIRRAARVTGLSLRHATR